MMGKSQIVGRHLKCLLGSKKDTGHGSWVESPIYPVPGPGEGIWLLQAQGFSKGESEL